MRNKHIFGGGNNGFILVNGIPLGFGKNEDGGLGLGHTNEVNIPQPVRIPGGKKIIEISVSVTHTLFLAESGNVYGSGDNKFGQLGPSWRGCLIMNPQQIRVQDIASIQAGVYASFFITSGGKILSCGIGHNGVLGHGDLKDQPTPKLIEKLSNHEISEVICNKNDGGSSNCTFFIERRSGQLLSCGYNEGNGPRTIGRGKKGESKKHSVPEPVPGKHNFVGGANALENSIFFKGRSALFINTYDEIRIKGKSYTKKSCEVPVERRIKSIEAGYNFFIVLYYEDERNQSNIDLWPIRIHEDTNHLIASNQHQLERTRETVGPDSVSLVHKTIFNKRFTNVSEIAALADGYLLLDNNGDIHLCPLAGKKHLVHSLKRGAVANSNAYDNTITIKQPYPHEYVSRGHVHHPFIRRKTEREIFEGRNLQGQWNRRQKRLKRNNK